MKYLRQTTLTVLTILTCFVSQGLVSQGLVHANDEFSYPTSIEPELANRFAALALSCVQQEFPNKISRTTDNAEAIGRPRKIFPTFYGCFDWHSAVHGHWLLVRLLHVGPQDAPWRDEAIES